MAQPTLSEPLVVRAGGPHPTVTALAGELGVSMTMAEHLHRRGFIADERTARFLDPKLSQLTLPDSMVDRHAAAERLAQAIAQNETIFVFGDYDCDGITSAAILTEVLQTLGGRVSYGLASRFDGGYGVSKSAVKRIINGGTQLLVTCDCGSSDHENLALVKAAGIDVIVIDHHLVPEAPLPVTAFLNPHRPECGFPYKGLASCGLVLSVAAALRQALNQPLDLKNWLDLVAIGTIADVAPLDGDNRALVRAGLKRLQENPRPGLRALMALAQVNLAHPLRAQDVAFRIAPRINAPGRLGSPELALELLLCKEAEPAEALAAQLEQLSSERKAQQESMLSEAIQEIETKGWQAAASLTLGRPGWNHGIVGIVAGRLADRYQRPVIVIGFDGAVGRGSVRGPKGTRLHDALCRVESSLVRFGGHQAAAGLEVEAARLEDLRTRFETVCAELARHTGTEKVDLTGDVIEVSPEDDLSRVLADFTLLEPCGEANPAPELAICARLVSARQVRGGHLKLELEYGARRLSGFGLLQGELADSLSGQVRVVGSLRPDHWRGGNAVELRVSQIQSLDS